MTYHFAFPKREVFFGAVNLRTCMPLGDAMKRCRLDHPGYSGIRGNCECATSWTVRPTKLLSVGYNCKRSTDLCRSGFGCQRCKTCCCIPANKKPFVIHCANALAE